MFGTFVSEATMRPNPGRARAPPAGALALQVSRAFVSTACAPRNTELHALVQPLHYCSLEYTTPCSLNLHHNGNLSAPRRVLQQKNRIAGVTIWQTKCCSGPLMRWFVMYPSCNTVILLLSSWLGHHAGRSRSSQHGRGHAAVDVTHVAH